MGVGFKIRKPCRINDVGVKLLPFRSARVSQASQSSQIEFNPFLVAPLFRRTWWIFLLIPTVLMLALIVTSIEGTRGTIEDFQFWSDLQRIFRPDSIPGSLPGFPLARDVTSWFLVSVMVVTCSVVHYQWQLMTRCLPDLEMNGVLKKLGADARTRNLRSRVLLLDRVLRDCKPEDSLSVLIHKINSVFFRNIAKARGAIVVIAVVLALSLILGARANGLFQVWAPSEGREEWILGAYNSWWAGAKNPLGMSLYFLLSAFFIYAVLLQNIVGLACAYVAAALPIVAELNVDWLNRDGRYGWTPIAKVFRSVYLSLGVHGLAISVLLVVLDVESFPGIVVLVVLWVAVLPLYVVAPWFTFRQIGSRARSKRIIQIEAAMKRESVNVDYNFVRLQPFLAEVERVRTARIRPLRMRAFEFSTLAAVVLLPIVLTAAQIFFEVRFGKG